MAELHPRESLSFRAPRSWRLETAFTLAVAVLLALLTLFTYVTYRDILSERGTAEIDNALVISRTVAVEVESFVRGLEDTVLAIASVVGLQHAPLDQSKTGAYLRTVFDDYKLLRALFLIDVNGRVVSTATVEIMARGVSQSVLHLDGVQLLDLEDLLQFLAGGYAFFQHDLPQQLGGARRSGGLGSAGFTIVLVLVRTAPQGGSAHRGC